MKRLALVVMITALLVGTGTAAADAPTRQGWWSASPVPAPDVPPDGLVIEGGPTAEAPRSFAALTFTLPVGASTGDLTLQVAPDSATVPNTSVQLCRLTASFQPAQGGPMADAPKFDCAGAVTATVEDDRLTAATASLVGSDGQLAIAILPAAPTDRIVLTKPDATALQVTAAPSTETFSSDSFSSDSFASDLPADSSTSFAPVEAPIDLPPVAVAEPSAPVEVTTPTTTEVNLTAAPASAESPAPGKSGTPAAAVALLLAITTAAGLWYAAGASADRRVGDQASVAR